MEQEKEAYGFYFSSHPVDRHAQLAIGTRRYADLGEVPISSGSRAGAKMAVLVEDTRWRTSAKGRKYLMATLSDPSGQFVATCFDEGTSADLEAAARVGGCGLAMVELDRREGEETPRVTIRSLTPFEELQRSARMELIVTARDVAAIGRLAEVLGPAGAGRGEVRLIVDVSGRAEPVELLLGRTFLIDAEALHRIEAIAGLTDLKVDLVAKPQLALVG